MKRLSLLSLLLILGGCGILGLGMLDRLYGPEDPSRFDQPQTTLAEGRTVDFRQQVKPILDSRCVACHACYDAPCQLQLGSYEGITRGANRERVYNATRLFAARPTRLFFDADNNRKWRQRGFFPVLNERNQDAATNLSASVLAQALALKQEVPGPAEGLLPNRSFDFSLDRQEVCPALDGWSDYRQRHPDWGMPFGLPPLTSTESATLMRWLEQGAPPSPEVPTHPKAAAQVAAMEAFLNGKSLKEQLMARYLFEHWFLAHLYFEEDKDKTFFELVRSATPPGQPIRVIATRRPYDDPGVPKVYYRLRPVRATLVAKTHMPYALGKDRLQRIREWFLEDPYPVTALPSYDPEKSANPFITFREIPVRARYRLLLENAQFTVMGFIKGPSCRGQTALNVIDDHFWVSFVHPDIPQIRNSSEFLSEALTQISLPTAQQSNALFSPWLIYSRQQNEYLQRKAAYVNQLLTGQWRPTLNELWDGDGFNQNAALTIFRHFDSASVEKGLLGGHPQKALIVGFEVLERIHYLLVAGFDVYGNLPHQLQSRLYMDFLRMEGEQNILILLPQAARKPVRDHWYRGASADVREYLNGTRNYFNPQTGITYHTDNPLTELYDAWVRQMEPVLDHTHDLPSAETSIEWLNRLAAIRGRPLQNLPENSLLTLVKANGTEQVFTLIRNSAHSNIAGLFDEGDRRLPDEDTLYVARGFIGAYPNVMYRVQEGQLADFVAGVQQLASPADYTKFAERFAIRRTDPNFWQHYDRLIAAYRANAPIEAGALDLSRYENR